MKIINNIINEYISVSKFKKSAYQDYHNVFKKTIRDLYQVGFKSLKEKSVLDLGCGPRYAFALLCASNGAMTTALDTGQITKYPLLSNFRWGIFHGGLVKGMLKIIKILLFDRAYFAVLEALDGRPLLHFSHYINFIEEADPEKPYPLNSDSFDLIVSNAVLEHVKNIPFFASEVKRLLKSGGIFYAIIHNFFSISGGHHREWSCPNERVSLVVPPWDHLRENLFPVKTYLNRLKPEDYLEAFKKELNVVLFESRDLNQDHGVFEGESLLTREVYKDLISYPKELLLSRSWCMICKKS